MSPLVHMYYDACNIPLCEACVREHISDEFKEQKVVLFKKWGLTPRCLKYSAQLCDLYCQPNIPFCVWGVFPLVNIQITGILKIHETKKENLQRDLQEFKNFILLNHQETTSNIPGQLESRS